MPDNEQQPPAPPQSEHPISDYFDGVKQLEVAGYETGIKKARTALFVTAVVLFAGELISASIQDVPITGALLGIAVFEAAIFVALGFWTKTRPFAAISIGLIIFIGLWVLAIIVSGFRGAIGGILVRAIIIYYLASNLSNARAWEQARKNN